MNLTRPFQERSTRVIRIFVSSTFRDMQRERDMLMTRVFPQVRHRCEQRGVIWREIDLRWGITMEESRCGGALRLCLEEVELCSPFFIALLGERYGYVPKELSAEILERFPWVGKLRDRSVTEMEIVAGALSFSAPVPTVLFYFRDPKYVERPSRSSKAIEYQAESDEARSRLADLKRRIEGSGHKVTRYASPEDLEGIVAADLHDMIQGYFPTVQRERPIQAQWSFARARGAFFVGHAAWLRTINRHVAGVGPPLLIWGDRGSGKSALFTRQENSWIISKPDSWWWRLFSKFSPAEQQAEHIVPWFVGSFGDREGWQRIARAFTAEIERTNPEDPPGPPATLDALELRSRFTDALRRLSERTVLLIDGVDQIHDFDPEAPLAWFPQHLPPHVRVIMSATNARLIECARRQRWHLVKLDVWSVADRRTFITEWLRTFGRKLNRESTERIASARQTAQPLYLRTLLEELRMFGSFERLPDKIDESLQAKTARELYGQMLARLEGIGDAIRVRDLFTLLRVSRRGLTEAELAILLASRMSPLPSAKLSPILLAAREALASTRGRLRCDRLELRDAICERYSEGRDSTARECIVGYSR
ncbi:MAG: DUF4062 domain-containing protein [Verrucomicrobia bacterium]|nr:MAG: DUF4062 domain-containing protein [Verrucomicrobiota bacterium]